MIKLSIYIKNWPIKSNVFFVAIFYNISPKMWLFRLQFLADFIRIQRQSLFIRLLLIFLYLFLIIWFKVTPGSNVLNPNGPQFRLSPSSPTQIDPFYTYGDSIKMDDKMDDSWVRPVSFFFFSKNRQLNAFIPPKYLSLY